MAASDFDHDDACAGGRRRRNRDTRTKPADCLNKKQAGLTRREQKQARSQEAWIAKVTPEADVEAGLLTLTKREQKEARMHQTSIAKVTQEAETMEETAHTFSEHHSHKDRKERSRSKSAKAGQREGRTVTFAVQDPEELRAPEAPGLTEREAEAIREAAAARERREREMERRERELSEADAMEALRAEAAAATAAVALLKSAAVPGGPEAPPKSSKRQHPGSAAEEDEDVTDDDLEGWTIL